MMVGLFFLREMSEDADNGVVAKRSKSSSANDVYYRMNVVIKSTHFIHQEISEENVTLRLPVAAASSMSSSTRNMEDESLWNGPSSDIESAAASVSATISLPPQPLLTSSGSLVAAAAENTNSNGKFIDDVIGQQRWINRKRRANQARQKQSMEHRKMSRCDEEDEDDFFS